VAYTTVHTNGAIILTAPVSEFRPADMKPQMTENTEALVIKNTDTMGVYMSVQRRNMLAETIDSQQTLIDMLAAGATWEDVERSAQQVKAGQGKTTTEMKRAVRERSAHATSSP
jgi:hypothetical protein